MPGKKVLAGAVLRKTSETAFWRIPSQKYPCLCWQESFIKQIVKQIWSWGSSVSIVFDYRMDDRGSISGRGNGFFPVACIQASSEVHPAFYSMVIRGNPYRGKSVTLAWRWLLIPRQCRGQEWVGAKLLSRLASASRLAGQFLTFIKHTAQTTVEKG
jgi:hypothetical protein